MKRKRTKFTRYSPDLIKSLRAEMLKCPNPAFGQMVKGGQMSDGDMVNFALTMAQSYFSGALLESVRTTTQHLLVMQMRRAMLVTAARFGATARFIEDGDAIITPLKGADAATRTAAVQALVDVGMSVAEAQSLLADPPIHGQSSWNLPAPMLSATVVN